MREDGRLVSQGVEQPVKTVNQDDADIVSLDSGPNVVRKLAGRDLIWIPLLDENPTFLNQGGEIQPDAPGSVLEGVQPFIEQIDGCASAASATVRGGVLCGE